MYHNIQNPKPIVEKQTNKNSCDCQNFWKYITLPMEIEKGKSWLYFLGDTVEWYFFLFK
jgi:hypothetical protein